MNNPFAEKELKHFLHTFKRQPLLIAKAKGALVWDNHGKKYFDFFSGLAVCGVGHNHPKVVQAIRSQAGKVLHSSNYFYTHPQMQLAESLTRRYEGSRVFFSNSGAEANELAIKLARLWATRNNKPGREIITFENAFHGRTLATTTASWGRSRSNDVFEPLPQGFHQSPFNDLEKLKQAVTTNTIAILLEPVQGEGGINIATPEFMAGIAQLCEKQNLLLLMDEVQTGMGRTGKFFAFEHYGIKPDVITLAKGLAGGLPLGATLAITKVAQHMVPGLHGSTFGGNPVACAASLEVLKLLTPRALQQIQKSAECIKDILSSFTEFPSVKAIRSFGLMTGMELHESGDPYVELARERGLLINCTQGHVLRFLPPYFISRPDLMRCIKILRSVFETLNKPSRTTK
ncbi:MAG: Acetylornithine aminotransferase [Elusimicrobia bacterium]|nr:Acetylornithine aminotransferase [Elusimicrobiota bacterium]